MRTPTIPTQTGKDGKPETVATVLSTAPLQDVEMDAPLPKDVSPAIAAPVVADASTKGDPAKNELEPTVPEVFAEVLEDKVIHDGVTGRVKLRAGKVVSNAQYDLRALHRQGVKMKRVEKRPDPNDFSFLQ